MSISASNTRRARDRLGPLEQVALSLVEDVFKLLENDYYLDEIEELVDTDDIDPDSEEGGEVYMKRLDAATEKIMTRTARALLNYCTGRPDRIVHLATVMDTEQRVEPPLTLPVDRG